MIGSASISTTLPWPALIHLSSLSEDCQREVFSPGYAQVHMFKKTPRGSTEQPKQDDKATVRRRRLVPIKAYSTMMNVVVDAATANDDDDDDGDDDDDNDVNDNGDDTQSFSVCLSSSSELASLIMCGGEKGGERVRYTRNERIRRTHCVFPSFLCL